MGVRAKKRYLQRSDYSECKQGLIDLLMITNPDSRFLSLDKSSQKLLMERRKVENTSQNEFFVEPIYPTNTQVSDADPQLNIFHRERAPVGIIQQLGNDFSEAASAEEEY